MELDEILSLSDRILTMFEGEIVGETAADESDARVIGAAMAGAAARPPGGVTDRSEAGGDSLRAVDIVVPLLNLALALAVAGVVVAAVGEDPLEALALLLRGALGYPEAVAYTLYYATNFVFTGLAVAVAFHAGCSISAARGRPVSAASAPASRRSLSAAGPPGRSCRFHCRRCGFRRPVGLRPGWLRARRGSHVVIVTIMFNFLAAALMTWLLVEVLAAPGQQAAESRPISPAARIPSSMTSSPGSVSISAIRRSI